MADRRDILVMFGQDARAMARTVFREARPLAGFAADARILLKPNLVVAKPASSGATTRPELVAGVIEALRDEGFGNLAIAEGSWVGDRTARAFDVCGYEALSRRYGVPLIDLQRDEAIPVRDGDEEYFVCRTIREADAVVNLPVLKGHCQTRVTAALKNLKGCIPDREKRRYHRLGIHEPVARLNRIVRPVYALVDAIAGDPDFEEGGDPVPMNRVVGCADPVLLDTYLAGLLGYRAEEIPYIGLAESFGVGSAALRDAGVRFLNRGEGMSTDLERHVRRTFHASIDERAACSACFGALAAVLRGMTDTEIRGLPPLRIGQGFRDGTGDGFGIGDCCRGREPSIPGCPPTVEAIRSGLVGGMTGA